MASFLSRSGVRVLLVPVHGLAATHNRMTANPRAFEHAMNAIRAGLGAGMRHYQESGWAVIPGVFSEREADRVSAAATLGFRGCIGGGVRGGTCWRPRYLSIPRPNYLRTTRHGFGAVALYAT
jgi:hypothetical protein